jgi:hypothetical protein
MLSFPELVRIYVSTQPTDMRKGFDSLAAVVRDWLGHDPLSGHLFVFRSRRGDRVKLLWWDKGMCLAEHVPRTAGKQRLTDGGKVRPASRGGAVGREGVPRWPREASPATA